MRNSFGLPLIRTFVLRETAGKLWSGKKKGAFILRQENRDLCFHESRVSNGSEFMYVLAAVFGASFLICLLITPPLRRLAKKHLLVDKPDGRRKVDAGPIPLVGGIAILLSASAALGVLYVFPNDLSNQLFETRSIVGLGLAALVLCVIGVADDYGCLRARHKLLGQIVVTIMIVNSGLMVRNISLFNWEVELGVLAGPLTIIWLLGAINSMNLIDGMDGLLGVVGVIISLAIAVMAILGENWGAACIALALAGTLLGFLVFNLPPASIYLGDAGSMLIGLVLGILALQGSLKGPVTVALMPPAALLTIPFFDTLAAIVRRKLTGRSIYTTDCGHLHHSLLQQGYSKYGTLLYVALFCLCSACGAMASVALDQELFAVLAIGLVLVVLVSYRWFGHAEFALLKTYLGSIAGSLPYRREGRNARTMEMRLQGTVNWGEPWKIFTTWAPQLDLLQASLNVNAPTLREVYHASWQSNQREPEEHDCWRAEFPLRVQGHSLGYLKVKGRRDRQSVWERMTTVLELVAQLETDASALLRIDTERLPHIEKKSTAPGAISFHPATVEILAQSGPTSLAAA